MKPGADSDVEPGADSDIGLRKNSDMKSGLILI